MRAVLEVGGGRQRKRMILADALEKYIQRSCGKLEKKLKKSQVRLQQRMIGKTGRPGTRSPELP